MQNFIYDIAKKVFRASDGSTIPGYAPAVSFGEKPVWAIQLVDTSQESPLDLSGIYSWRAAMDTDFSSDTEPMARTVSGITATMGDFGPVVSIPIETATLRFLQICNGRQKTSAYFELAGLDGNGDTVFYVCFPVSCLFPIDPVAAGVLEGVDVTTLTQSQVEAIASAAAQAMLGQDVRDAVAQAMEGYDPYPDGGTAGQVLTKTDNGAEWADAPSGGSSGESSYTLPPATSDTLGGVKVGSGLSITEDGTLSATGASGTSQAEWGGIGGTLSNQSDLKEALDAKAEKSAVDAHVADSSIHVTSEEKAAWGAKAAGDHNHDARYLRIDYKPAGGNQYIKSGLGVDGALTAFGLYSDSGITQNKKDRIADLGIIKEQGTLLSDKYAAKSHKHAMGDITGLPASGGTAGQVLTKTATGAEWADAPSGGTSGEAGTDAGAVRYVKSYDDYLKVCDLAREQEIHHSATFIPAADVTGDTIEVRKAISGEVTDDTLRKGRIYVQINEAGTGGDLTRELTREVTTSTYVVQKVRIVNSSTGGTYGNWVIISGREGTPYLYPNSYEKAYGGQHGFTFVDRQTVEDTYLNGGWPTVSLNAQSLLGAYKADLEQDGTYIGTTPWYAADAKTSGEVLKRVNGVWRKGNVAYNSSTGETSESFDEATEYKIVLLFTDSSGSYQDTLTPNSTETTIEHNTRLGNHVIDCLDITPDQFRLAIQALEGTALAVSPGKAYSATLAANATLTATGGEEGYRQEAFLDVNPGAYSLTPGYGITFAQDLTAGKVNHCRIVWTGTSARLLVDDVTDAAASGGSGGSGEEGGGSESGGSSDAFPTTFTVTACSGNEAAKGEYTRTGETTTVGGTDYPVYSYTQPVLATTFYIYVCQYRQGSAGAFWSLKDGSYSASDEGYSGLGSVAAGSDGLPSSQTWEASSSSATVSWA